MDKQITIGQITPTLSKFTFVAIVIDKGYIRSRMGGDKVHGTRVADHSGSVTVEISTADYFDVIRVGDILRFRNVIPSVYRTKMKVYCGKYSELARIGDFQFLFSETPDMSESNPEYAIYQKERPERSDANADRPAMPKDPRRVVSERATPQQTTAQPRARDGVPPATSRPTPSHKDPRMTRPT
ncbi:unnamed protein product, partial [Mesorhabditis belari]|uniref:Uncharacterized protein n=1 Tax=Mesorhabditis belari TaxID=2138241 RepID=A0AAF3J9V9_9BILA